MPGTLKAIDADRVDAGSLSRKRVSNGDALVDYLDAGSLQARPMIGGLGARRLHNLDSAFNDHSHVFSVRRRGDGGEYRQIDAESLIGHGTAAFDLMPKRFRRGLRERCKYAEATCIGDSCR